MTDDAIRQELLNAGWNPNDVNQALGMNSDLQSIGSEPTRTASNEEFIQKWSWGGFFLIWIYFLANSMYKKAFLYFIGYFIPLFNIYLAIKSGLRGRKMVWESGQWSDFESYKKRQSILDKIGIGLVLLSFLFGIIGSFFAIMGPK